MGKNRRKNLPEGRFEADITALSHEGRGIAKVDGKTVFIPFALSGERVAFEYTLSKATYDEGRLLEVLQPVDARVSPPCPHFEICGGCALQHLSLTAQILHKQQTLLSHYRHFAKGLEPETLLAPIVSPRSEGYRTKARLGVRYVHKKNKVLVGFRERNGRFLAEIDRCKVLHQSIGGDLTALQDLIFSLSIYKEIPQIEIAVDEERSALIIRHLVPFSEKDLEKLKSFAIAGHLWIYLQSKGPQTIRRLSPESTQRPLQMSYHLPAYNLTLDFAPNDFTQVNPDVNRKMLDQALLLLAVSSEDNVLDLFCGLGNFSLPLATKAKRVVGIEGDEAMVQRAALNAKRNGLGNTAFYAANLFEAFTTSAWLKETKFHKLLLDPPRAGAEFVCQNIEQIAPKRIVYVSCNPATLARDAGILVNEKGYRLKASGVMDMFSHTAHVESMALFEK